MQSLGCLAMVLLQDEMGALQHDVHLMTIFMGIIAAAVIFGFIAVAVAGLKILPLILKVEEMAERIEGRLTPMMDKTSSLMTDLGPRVRTLTENAEQISYTVRGKVDELGVTVNEINRTVQDINKRTQAQVVRVDGMVGEALDTAQNVSRKVQDGVRKPVQQIAGIIAGVKVGIETLVERSPFGRPARTTPPEGRPYDAAGGYAGATETEFAGTRPYDL